MRNAENSQRVKCGKFFPEKMKIRHDTRYMCRPINMYRSMYVCMLACIYIHTYVSLCIYIHICISVYIYIYIYAHMYNCVYIYICNYPRYSPIMHTFADSLRRGRVYV